MEKTHTFKHNYTHAEYVMFPQIYLLLYLYLCFIVCLSEPWFEAKWASALGPESLSSSLLVEASLIIIINTYYS